MEIVSRKIVDKEAIWLIKEIINGSNSKQPDGTGIPIGNLTSQVFANIYLNEFDRFLIHDLKPQFYLRYGDDFILGANYRIKTEKNRRKADMFLQNVLKMEINRKNDIIVPCGQGLSFLGVEIYSTGRRLKKRTWQAIDEKLELKNTASYLGIVRQHAYKRINFLNWLIFNQL